MINHAPTKFKMKKELKNVTLLGIDCADIDRLIQAAEICMKDFEFGAVKLLTSLDSNNPNIVGIDHIGSTAEYSEFVIKNLDSYVDTDFVLVIQYDGFILNPDAWTDEFLQYDYIGSPWLIADWSVDLFGIPKELLGQRFVGNGGFSLRSKKLLSLCAKLAKEGVFKEYDPEDMVICVYNKKLFEDNEIKFAPLDLARKFSIEGDEDGVSWSDEFGFHGLRYTDISAWLMRHPEYHIENPLNERAIRNKEIELKK